MEDRSGETALQNGALTPYEVSVSPWREDEYYTAIVRDISERNKAEAELEKYRKQLEETVKDRTAQLELNRDRGEALFSNMPLGLAELLVSQESSVSNSRPLDYGKKLRQAVQEFDVEGIEQITGHLNRCLNKN